MFTYHITLQVVMTVEASDIDNAISGAIDQAIEHGADLNWQVEAVSSNDPRH